MPQTLPRLHTSLRRLTLRQRILLLFLGLAGACLAVLFLSLYLGHSKHSGPWSMDALITAGVVAGCGIVLLIFGLWRLFDENVAKPLERLSGELRARVHANINTDLEDLEARHLGDLAPAATALIRHLNEARNELAQTVARETARHVGEKDRLTSVLARLPFGVVVCTADHRLALYNAIAHTLLGKNGKGASQSSDGQSPNGIALCEPGMTQPSEQTRPGSRIPCLGRSVFEFVGESSLREAYNSLLQADPTAAGNAPVKLNLNVNATGATVEAYMQLLGGDGFGGAGPRGYALTLLAPELPHLHEGIAPRAQGPSPGVVYDLELLEYDLHDTITDTPLQAQTYVVFDTETTGLLPDRGDEIVQLAAVRVVNGRRVHSEVFNTLVNPGRPIPPSSTLIHGISDSMVANAPRIEQVVRDFHDFASGAVLVAHNIDFDMAFLRRAAKSVGLRFENPVLDTVVLSAKVFGDGENHNLDALAARLGVDLPPSARHTALGDATATAEILVKLLPALQARH